MTAKAKVFGWARLHIKVKDDKVILSGTVNKNVEKVVIPNFVTHIGYQFLLDFKIYFKV